MAVLVAVEPSSTSSSSQPGKVWARTLSIASARKSPASLKMVTTETSGDAVARGGSAFESCDIVRGGALPIRWKPHRRRKHQAGQPDHAAESHMRDASQS